MQHLIFNFKDRMRSPSKQTSKESSKCFKLAYLCSKKKFLFVATEKKIEKIKRFQDYHYFLGIKPMSVDRWYPTSHMKIYFKYCEVFLNTGLHMWMRCLLKNKPKVTDFISWSTFSAHWTVTFTCGFPMILGNALLCCQVKNYWLNVRLWNSSLTEKHLRAL